MKGLQLGSKKGKSSAALEAMKQQGLYNEAEAAAPLMSAETAQQQQQFKEGYGHSTRRLLHSAVLCCRVHVDITEHINIVMGRDEQLENMEIKGDVSLVVSDPNCAYIRLHVDASNCAGWKMLVRALQASFFAGDLDCALDPPSHR